MHVTLCVEGMNLERLLRMAMDAGILIHAAARKGTRRMHVRVYAHQAAQFASLCAQSGWTCTPIQAGMLVRFMRLLKARPMLVPAMTLCCALVYYSSQIILRIRVEGAVESGAQVRHVLQEENIRPGRFKRAIELQALRALLAHRLPGMAHASVYFAGSTLVVDCMPAIERENLQLAGGRDIVAAQSGIVSKIWTGAGTPQVEPGQAVHRGQVLIAGYERGEKETKVPVQAQGAVTARVYVCGEAKASLQERRSVETGQTRTRITVRTPWTQRVVREAKPFSSQDESRRIQRVVGLYLPLWREIETYAQTQVFEERRAKSDAASIAQGAAEKIARKQCPPDALILDKIVNYSMIDNEFVYASVVLELEAPIAGRIRLTP